MSATRRQNFLPPEPPPRDEVPDHWGAMPLDDFGDDAAPPPPDPIQAPPPEPSPGNAPELTEEGMASEFERRSDDKFRHVAETGKWLEWNGVAWRPTLPGTGYQFARNIIRARNRHENEKTREKTGKSAFCAGVETFAKRGPLAISIERLDADPWLLGTPGGVVDLRSGRLRAARLDNYITKITAITPADRADCPMWLSFLQQATGNDRDLIRFLQQWAGYCLTGSTREHALLFIYGPGGNGKSVFLNILRAMLGDYCSTAAMDTFAAMGTGRHLTFLAMLRGARLVTASETEEGQAWAEARIKQMTGGDPITANFMRCDPFTFTPVFKLTIAGNHKPVLRNVDEAMKRRFKVAPFLHVPEKPDRELEAKLQAELPGIMRWAIDGCLDWQKHGFSRPQVLHDATAEYFEAQDVIGRWITERCILAPHLEEKPGALLADCKEWCGNNGEAAPTAPQFRGALERRGGLRYVTVKGAQRVKGIGLHPPEGGGGWR
jgi:putative DNA primase/helicase